MYAARCIAIGSIVLGVALAGITARADGQSNTTTLGSSLGLDVYSSQNSSVYAFSTGGNPLLQFADPGLRLGYVMPHSEVAALIGTTVVAGEGFSFNTLSLTLDVNHLFQPASESGPYLGVHAGVSNTGVVDESAVGAEFGAQLGTRYMVSDGHGAIRVEARYSQLRLAQESVGNLGLRVGYDLWFR